jgi:hypothetical protein
MLNLGQGVAWDGWHGRGVRSNHPEDYPEYLPGCDIVSFYIYPVAHSNPQVAGNLWYVARGVERLVKWSAGEKVVWNCIECTRIQSKSKSKATPSQVRSEVWMSLIHGSMGLIYFVHEWQPRFDEAALLHDSEISEMSREVTAISRQITELAPVLNRPTEKGSVSENVMFLRDAVHPSERFVAAKRGITRGQTGDWGSSWTQSSRDVATTCASLAWLGQPLPYAPSQT